MGIGYAGAFLGGLVSVFSPCAALLLPSFFAYAFGSSRARLVGRTGLFYLGLLATLLPLGLAAGALGSLLARHREALVLAGAVVLVVFGVLLLLGISLPTPRLGASAPRGGTGAWAVVGLGAVYGLAGACTGPLLGAVLTLAATSGSAFYGAVLLALFGAGMVAPLLVLSLLWDRFDLARRLRPRPIRIGPIRTTVWGIVAGLLLIGIGVLFWLTDATGALGGVLDVGAQAELEGNLRRWAESVPDALALVVVALAAGALVWLGARRRQSSSRR